MGNTRHHKFQIHDRDTLFTRCLDNAIRALGVEVLRSPIASPKANAICERLIGTIRRECLDWMAIQRYFDSRGRHPTSK
jgi:hypothetical protein